MIIVEEDLLDELSESKGKNEEERTKRKEWRGKNEEERIKRKE